jgi:hypothetical protein
MCNEGLGYVQTVQDHVKWRICINGVEALGFAATVLLNALASCILHVKPDMSVYGKTIDL